MQKDLQKIVDYLEELREEFGVPKEKLKGIFYYNGQNGTDFDWRCNHHLSDICYSFPSSRSAFKLSLNRNGVATVFCYPNDEDRPVKTIKKQLVSKEEAYALKEWLSHNADGNCIYDAKVEQIESLVAEFACRTLYNHLNLDYASARDDKSHDYLSCHKARSGRRVWWYVDEKRSGAIYEDTFHLLTEEEIEDELC